MNGDTYIAAVTVTHPEMVLNPTLAAVPEMTATLDHQVLVDPDTYYLFFEVHGGDFAAFDDALATDHTVADPTVVVETDDSRVYRLRLASTAYLVLPKAADLGLHLRRASSAEGGWLITLQGSDRSLLSAFREYCAQQNVDMVVERLYWADEHDQPQRYGLTPAQHETLLAAFEHGYFDEPREASLADLAAELDLSRSAVGGRLRRGTRTLIQHTIGT